MLKLPNGVDINNLIDNLRIFSWEASDCLLHYSQLFKEVNYESHILNNGEKKDPVTIADLKVNETVIKRIEEKYADIKWGVLSEENAKLGENVCNENGECMTETSCEDLKSKAEPGFLNMTLKDNVDQNSTSIYLNEENMFLNSSHVMISEPYKCIIPIRGTGRPLVSNTRYAWLVGKSVLSGYYTIFNASSID